MKTTFTLTLICIVSCLLAQPTITTNSFPKIGDRFALINILNAETISPGGAGANVTWDFINVVSDPNSPEIDIVFDEPLLSSASGDFPDADVAQFQFLPGITSPTASFYKVDGDEFQLLGVSFDMGSNVYTNPRTTLKAPFTFGDQFTDESTSVFQTEGAPGVSSANYSTVSTTVTADGYGGLILPFDIIDNVLRIRTDEMRRDSFPIGAGIYNITEESTTIYTWVNADRAGIPLASLEITNSITITTYVPNVAPVVTTETEEPSFFIAIDESTSTFETPNSSLPFQLLAYGPNPVQDQLNIQLNSDCICEVNLQLINNIGQIVLTQQTQLLTGENTINLAALDLPKGNYFLQFEYNNQVGSVQLVKVE